MAVLGDGATLKGRVAGKDITILGRFEGTIDVKGTVRIGRQALVKAEVRAQAVEIDGEFEGEIRTSRLSFGETARAKGAFRADRLRIMDGALVDGAMNLDAAAPKPAPLTVVAGQNATDHPTDSAPASDKPTSTSSAA
jgi:cytoskeletal protein CcmA (bactofilin family)